MKKDQILALKTYLNLEQLNKAILSSIEFNFIGLGEENISKGSDEPIYRSCYIFYTNKQEVCRSPFIPDLMKKMEEEMGKIWMREKGLYKVEN